MKEEMEDGSISQLILEKEAMANERFKQGDYMGFLELHRDDVTYVNPMTPGILSGKINIRRYFEKSFPLITIEKSTWTNVNLVINDEKNLVILTYNQQNYIRSKVDGTLYKVPLWNCTNIYRLTDGEWKIAHNTWSIAQDPALILGLQELFAKLGY